MNTGGITSIIFNRISGFVNFWQSRKPGQQRAIIFMMIAIIAGAALMTTILNVTRFSVLYSGLTPRDAGEMLTQLEEMNVEAKAQGTDTILVPKDQVDWVRMELAAAGYPKDDANLDILVQGTGFGMTEEDKVIYRRYQLQQDLQNAISTFTNVLDAQVSLHIPESSSLLVDSQSSPATAAVLLTLRPGVKLEAGNVEAISELVQKSVAGLQAENVTIIDSNMNVLNVLDSGLDASVREKTALETEFQERLKQKILALLQPVFGVGNIMSEVHLSLDFDDSVIDQIRYEPADDSEHGVISSIVTSKNLASNSGTVDDDSVVTVYGEATGNKSVNEKQTESIEYQVNMIQEHMVKAKGGVDSISVSVLINDTGEMDEELIDQVRQLVSTAIGVNTDMITVDSLPFNGTESFEGTVVGFHDTQSKALEWERTRTLIYAGAGSFVALIFIFMIGYALKRPKNAIAVNQNNRQQAQTVAPDKREEQEKQDGLMEFKTDKIEISEEAREAWRVERHVDENPELAANIIKEWLAQE